MQVKSYIARHGSNLSEKEFSSLFSRCRDSFVKIANSYLHDIHAAEDVTDECFIKAWELRNEISVDNYEAYIFRMIVNRSLDHLKLQQARNRILQEIHSVRNRMQDYDINSLKNCDPDKLFSSEVMQIFNDCIAQMPSVTRRVFSASRFEGKTYNEISGEIGIPVRQVTAHMQYALKALRIALKDYILFSIIFF